MKGGRNLRNTEKRIAGIYETLFNTEKRIAGIYKTLFAFACGNILVFLKQLHWR